jgi:hypothetical protein
VHWLKRRAVAWLILPLAGCATLGLHRSFDSLPLLLPAALGAEVIASQRLVVSRDDGGAAMTLEAAVEVDAMEVRMAGLLLGQRVLLVDWDGHRLREQREPVVPSSVTGRALLRDLQLVYWPAESIRAVLPPGWRLEEVEAKRRLYHGATLAFESERRDADRMGGAGLWNHVGHYRIEIQSAP